MAAITAFKEKTVRAIEAHRPTISKMELESVLDCLINDQLGSGELVRKFEKSLAGALNFKHALAVNSLMSAYHLAYLALDLQAGDSVLMSALAPVEACDAAHLVGARVFVVDVDRNSFHPSEESIAKKIQEIESATGKPPSAFIFDHTFGSISPLNPVQFLEKEIKIIEDITGMVGVFPEEHEIGQTGHLTVCGLSDEDLLTTGNGGILFTTSPAMQGKLSAMRYGGKRLKNSVAFDYRMEDFKAALGLGQSSNLGILINRRQKIGLKYQETLRLTKHESYFRKPGSDAYLRFPVVISKNSEEVKRYFNSLHIGIRPSIENPVHHVLDLPRLEYPNAERIYQKGISIPLYPNLTANNVERICSSLRGLV